MGHAEQAESLQAESDGLEQAESILQELASVFFQSSPAAGVSAGQFEDISDSVLPNVEARYRTLVEQIPAVVFMAYLDRGIGEAYVSPQIEALLGFTQEEWLNDPVRWYQQIHPDDKSRWSLEAAQMFSFGGTAAVGVSSHGLRPPGDLVPLRSQDGPWNRWPPLVYPRSRFRCHRT